MNSNEIRNDYLDASMTVSKSQANYLRALDAFGAEDKRTQALWSAYLKADEKAQPAMVAMSQQIMRENRESMTDEEWSAIVD